RGCPAPNTAAAGSSTTAQVEVLGSLDVLGMSAQDAGVTQGIPPGLWPHTEAVRSRSDTNTGQDLAGRGIDGVHLAAATAREPQDSAVVGDAAHVRRSMRNGPRGDDAS